MLIDSEKVKQIIKKKKESYLQSIDNLLREEQTLGENYTDIIHSFESCVDDLHDIIDQIEALEKEGTPA